MSGTFKKSDRIVERQIRRETILVPIVGNTETLDSIYSLNETAGLIWREAAAGASELEIVDRLVSEFDISDETARADTARVLQELLALGALQPSAPPPS